MGTFRDSISVAEKHTLINIQKAYENGVLPEEKLSLKQIEDLISLYREQIINLDEEIKTRHRKLLSLG